MGSYWRWDCSNLLRRVLRLEDPQLPTILVSGGAVVVAFGLFMLARALEHPRSRLGTWLITIQLLGVVILGCTCQAG